MFHSNSEIETLALYLLIALVASCLFALGLLMMKSRACRLPVAEGAGTLRAIAAWVRDPIWSAGLIVQTVGYALNIVALAGAPISMVSVMMQGGIALFVLFAVTLLGERARPREWAGIAITISGMAIFGGFIVCGRSADNRQQSSDGAAIDHSFVRWLRAAENDTTAGKWCRRCDFFRRDIRLRQSLYQGDD